MDANVEDTLNFVEMEQCLFNPCSTPGQAADDTSVCAASDDSEELGFLRCLERIELQGNKSEEKLGQILEEMCLGQRHDMSVLKCTNSFVTSYVYLSGINFRLKSIEMIPLNEFDCLSTIKDDIFDSWNLYEMKSPEGVYITDLEVLRDIMNTLNSAWDALPFAEELMNNIVKWMQKGLFVERQCHRFKLKEFGLVFNDFGSMLINSREEVSRGLLTVILKWTRKYDSITCRLKKPKTVPSQRQYQCQCHCRCHCRCQCPCQTIQPKRPSCFQNQPCPHLKLGDFIQIIESCCFLYSLHEIILLTDFECDEQFYPDVLSVVGFLCAHSHLIYLSTLQQHILSEVLFKLEIPDESNVILSRTLDFVYAMLSKDVSSLHSNQFDEHGNEIPFPVEIFAPSQKAMGVLMSKFMTMLIPYYSKQAMELRNDLAFSIVLIVRKLGFKFNAEFGQYLGVIADAIMSSVMYRGYLFCVPSPLECLDLTKYLIWMVKLAIDPENNVSDPNDQRAQCTLPCNSELLSTLMDVATGKCPLVLSVSNLDLTEPLTSIAWNALFLWAKSKPKSFIYTNAIPALLECLTAVRESTSTCGQHQIRLATQASHVLRAILDHELVDPLANDDTMEIVEFFGDIRSVDEMLLIFEELVNYSLTPSPDSLMANLLMCFSLLGTHDTIQRDIFVQCHGVNALIRFMIKLTTDSTSYQNPSIQIALAECIWKVCSSSASALEMMLAFEGMFCFLDVLTIAIGPASQLHLLSALMQLCEYPRCVDQIMYWRRNPLEKVKQPRISDRSCRAAPKYVAGDSVRDLVLSKDDTLAAVFCEIWRDEETRLSVPRGPQGCISEITQPLKSQFAQIFSFTPMDGNGSLGCHDLIGSVRPKIFLVMKKMVESTKNEATMFGGLSVPNQITMQIITNFLDLKQAEIWMDLPQELLDDEVELIQADQTALDTLTRIASNKIGTVMESQRFLIQRTNDHDELNERELYDLLRQCKLKEHLRFAKHLQFLARTSNHPFLVASRLWQKAQLQQIARRIKTAEKVVRTVDGPHNYTVWPHRFKMVESESSNMERCDTADIVPALPPPPQPPQQTANTVEPSEPTDLDNYYRYYSSKVYTDDMFGKPNVKYDYRMPHLVSAVKSEAITPISADEGHYMIPPALLYKAIRGLVEWSKKWDDNNDDEFWKMRTKWRKDWYPNRVTMPKDTERVHHLHHLHRHRLNSLQN